jgi:ATP-dependent DNA helicase RecQ
VLQGEEVLSRIARRGVDHIAIDEAHCISEWGDTFRPVYLELKKIAERLKPRAVTAFTATASPRTLTRIAEALFDGRAHIVRGDTDRPNIMYGVYHCRAKDAALIREVARRERPMIVFCATRGGTERAAHLLRETLEDTDIRFYHAGLEKNEKIALETWFLAHPRAILCCTCAFGMGVDKKNIRTVIHRDSPPTVEAYVQEAGRGGRDGKNSEAVLLWSPADRKRLERLQSPARERAAVLIAFAESGRCRREVLLEALGDPRAESRESGAARGGERIACAGCDICDGNAVQYPRDERLIIDFIAKNRRAFTGEDAADALYTAGNRISKELTGCREWRRADFPAIINDLLKEKKLIRIDKWPWKGKLTIPKSDSSGFTPRHHPAMSRFSRVWKLRPNLLLPRRLRLPP